MLGVVLARAARATPTINLTECYRLALAQGETVAISEDEIGIAQAQYRQVLGAILPNLSLNASELLQDGSAGGDGGVGSTFTRTSRPEAAITLTQPIFHGFKDFYGLKALRAGSKAAAFARDNTHRLLLLDVARAYVAVVKIERDIATTRRMIAVSKKLLKELDERIMLGKSRPSERLVNETDLLLLEADLALSEGDLAVGYELMSFLTGRSPHPKLSHELPGTRKKSLAAYVSAAQGRADVKESRMDVEVARHNKKMSRADFLPTVDLEANAYAYRTGFQEDIRWDATFSLSLPIFDYALWGAAAETKLKHHQAQLTHSYTKRTAESEVRRSWLTYVAVRSRLSRTRLAVERAHQSYEHEAADFDHGLVDFLDLLQAQRTWLNAQRAHDAAAADVALAGIQLEITAGVLP